MQDEFEDEFRVRQAREIKRAFLGIEPEPTEKTKQVIEDEEEYYGTYSCKL